MVFNVGEDNIDQRTGIGPVSLCISEEAKREGRLKHTIPDN